MYIRDDIILAPDDVLCGWEPWIDDMDDNGSGYAPEEPTSYPDSMEAGGDGYGNQGLPNRFCAYPFSEAAHDGSGQTTDLDLEDWGLRPLQDDLELAYRAAVVALLYST